MATRRTAKQGLTPALVLSAGVACVLYWLFASGVALGQTTKKNQDFTIAVNVNRVVLDVTVRDRQGRLVPGLLPEQFHVFEDGVEQEVLDVSQADRPLTLGLVIDSSRSIGERRREIIVGALRLAGLSHEDDDLFLVSFNDAPRFGLTGGVEYTRNLPTLRKALFRMKPEGMTSLYDAVLMTLDHLAEGKWERQAAVIFSDGGDTASRATLDEAIEGVRSSNALVYAIGLASDINPYRSPKTLKKLTHASGGAAYFPLHENRLEQVCEEIATEIRSQYSLTYAPASSRQEGRYRKIEIKLTGNGSRNWRVRTREGYYEPGGPEGAPR